MKKDVENKYYLDDEIDLYSFWLVIKKRWLIIFIITLFSCSFAFFYSLVVPKIYKVSNILMLNQMQDGDVINQGEVTAALTILNKLKSQQKNVSNMFAINGEDFKDITNIRTEEIKGSTALWVEIETKNKQAGTDVMNSLPQIIFSNPNIVNKIKLQKELLQKNRDDLKGIIDNSKQDIKISRDKILHLPSMDLYNLREKYNRINIILEKMSKDQFVTLAWKTEPPSTPYRPNVKFNVLIGLVVGGFLGCIVAFFVNWVEYAGNMRLLKD